MWQNSLNRFMDGPLRVVMPMLLVLLLSFGALPVQASTLGGIKLLSDAGGQNLRIMLDSAAEYQVFNLEGPSRLVINFPGATLANNLSQVQGDGGIEYVTPVQDDAGVRVEIGLAKGTHYEIAEKGNDLMISFRSEIHAATAGGARITDLQVRDVDAVTELVLSGEHLDANHNVLLTNNGKTLVVDFWGGASQLPKDHYAFSAQYLDGVIIGAADKRLRLVANLHGMIDGSQQVDASADRMVIRLGKVAAKKAVTNGTMVESVEFQPDSEVAHLLVRTNKADPIINIQEDGDNVILDVKQAHLAAGQERSQDVRAFPGPVRKVDSYGKGRDVRIVARMREAAEVSSYQSGNVLTLTLRPKIMLARQTGQSGNTPEAKVYTGQKVTFNYKDIDIRNALQLIAEMSDLNIILADDVQGTLTMRLIDVPWDQALDLILQARGLGKEQSGNVVRIAPLDQLRDDAEKRKAAKKSLEEIAPLETEYFQIGYASVNDVKRIIEGDVVQKSTIVANTDIAASSASTSTSGGGGKQGAISLMSERGTILLDERSNTLIVRDTREHLNNIRRLIEKIDKPMQQVMIEARIVEATDTFSRDLGIRWGGQFNSTGTRFTQGVGVGTPAAQGNLVDLGALVGPGAGGAIGYSLGTLSGALNLNLELSAAETNGDAKVVSRPRVFTSNLQEALIEQNEQVAFNQVTTSGGATTVTPIFKDAKLSLKVMPQITADKRIIMQLTVNKDTPVTDATGAATAVNAKTVQTRLLVKDGQTVVLGGIYSQTQTDTIAGVPGLKDLPLVGHLFKRKQKVNNRSELLIFITPTIIDDKVVM